MLKRIAALATLTSTLLFSFACGGGGNSNGGGNGGGTLSATAQGVYQGTASDGSYFETIILPNDMGYAIYGTMSGNTFYVDGMLMGQGHSITGTYSASLTDYYFIGYTGYKTAASMTASYVPGTALNGSVSEGGSSLNFTGTAIPATQFNYNTPATTSSLVGTWAGYSLEGSYSTVTVSSSGSVTGTSAGCNFSGTVTPDSSKNFYNVSLSFGASPCLAPNQTAHGIAVAYLLSDGITHQVVVGGTTSGGDGTVFVANKQ